MLEKYANRERTSGDAFGVTGVSAPITAVVLNTASADVSSICKRVGAKRRRERTASCLNLQREHMWNI
jgi:hypothetical protein